jgi:hypothetical protein
MTFYYKCPNAASVNKSTTAANAKFAEWHVKCEAEESDLGPDHQNSLVSCAPPGNTESLVAKIDDVYKEYDCHRISESGVGIPSFNMN